MELLCVGVNHGFTTYFRAAAFCTDYIHVISFSDHKIRLADREEHLRPQVASREIDSFIRCLRFRFFKQFFNEVDVPAVHVRLPATVVTRPAEPVLFERIPDLLGGDIIEKYIKSPFTLN